MTSFCQKYHPNFMKNLSICSLLLLSLLALLAARPAAATYRLDPTATAP